MSSAVDELKQRRLDRMRQGKSAADIRGLLSDEEFRVALIPLTEAEYDAAMQSVASNDVPNNLPGASWADRREQQELLVRAIRDPLDFSKKLFSSVKDLNEALETSDINHLYDAYLEMAAAANPSIDGLPDEELGELKKVLEEINLSELSGRQWYALIRFLSTLSVKQLPVRFPGSTSIK